MKKNSFSNQTLVISGVKITHADRILESTKQITKGQLASYCDEISEFILPYLVNRPIVMYRCPEGEKCFYQKHYAKYFPPAIHKILINENESNKKSEYVTIKNKKGLISLIQFSTLELHPWAAQYNTLEKPDQITFDLDPGPSVAWKQVIKTAVLLRDILEQLNLRSFIKTSGGKGLHIVVPLRKSSSWPTIKSFAHNIALYMVHAYPELYTDNPLKSKRKGKIFIDYLRNGRGSTSVAAYSIRAKPGAPISTPIAWEELSRLKSAAYYDISNIMKRMSKLKKDPWEDFFKCKQTLPKIDL